MIPQQLGLRRSESEKHMKYAVVILDGAAGEPLDIFNGLTTLEQATTPFLDLLGREGACGLSKNVPDGFEPASNVACMSIMGYDPAVYDIGRGAIEGASLGVDLQPGDIALRLNLCCVEDGVMKSYSTGNISTEDSHALADELAAVLDDEVFHITKGVSFRHILTVHGHPELMDLNFCPPHNFTDQPLAGHEPQGEGAQLLLDYMERAAAVLAASPVNARRVSEGLLPATNAWAFWPGMRPEGMASFEEAYQLKAGMLSPVDLLNGLAELTGIERFDAEGMSDGPENDYASQGRRAIEILKHKDIVFVHVEAPDTAGHDGEPQQKVDAIEAIDSQIISRLVDYAGTCELRILALPDHYTPICLKTHSRGMVPFVLWGPGIEANAGTRLTEKEAAISGLVCDPGWQMLSKHVL